MLGRTLSTRDRNNKDEVAKETLLSKKRTELNLKMADGDITEAEAKTISNAINYYVRFNGGKTLGGFERGLTQLIETQLDLLQNEKRTESLPNN